MATEIVNSTGVGPGWRRPGKANAERDALRRELANLVEFLSNHDDPQLRRRGAVLERRVTRAEYAKDVAENEMGIADFRGLAQAVIHDLPPWCADQFDLRLCDTQVPVSVNFRTCMQALEQFLTNLLYLEVNAGPQAGHRIELGLWTVSQGDGLAGDLIMRFELVAPYRHLTASELARNVTAILASFGCEAEHPALRLDQGEIELASDSLTAFTGPRGTQLTIYRPLDLG